VKESVQKITSLGSELEQLSGPDFIYIGEVKIAREDDPASHIYLMVVKDHVESRTRAPYVSVMGDIEEIIVSRLVRRGVLPKILPHAQKTHAKTDDNGNEQVIFGRFPFEYDGEQHELMFPPTEEYGRDTLAYLQIGTEGILSPENVQRLNELLRKGVFPYQASRERYEGLFTSQSASN